MDTKSRLKKLIREAVAAEIARITEAKIPTNVRTWAERIGVEDDVEEIASWAEKAGQRIVGGTAIGKDYATLILDLTYQGGEIYFDTETGQVELYGEPVRTEREFQEVFDAAQEDSDEDRPE